jgi:hypothetical protein
MRFEKQGKRRSEPPVLWLRVTSVSTPYAIRQRSLNFQTPNVNYSCRTAPLTSKVAFYIFIKQIYVPDILNMVYTLRFFLFKMQYVS